MLNRLCLTTVISAAIVVQLVPSGNKSAIAQEREGCFIVNSAGAVINLNQLCSPLEPAIQLTGNDGKFIEDYKRLAKSYSPEATDNLLQAVQRTPGQKIVAAKRMCAEAKSGVSLPEFKLRAIGQAASIENAIAKESFLADADITVTLASNHYCPELANK
jgi:transcriptional regulator of acetoin/glycerol metabolism